MTINESVAASVAVLLIQKNSLLLGKRIKDGVFEGWQCPGGYLLPGETIDIAAKRLCLQRAGIDIDNICPGPYTNNVFSDLSVPKHTVTLYVIAREFNVRNEDVFENRENSWGWYEVGAFPEKLFSPLKTLTEQYDMERLICL